MTTEWVGPFPEEIRLVVDGYQVPHIAARKNGDGWTLVLDGRYAIDVTEDEVERWLWWVANAMAVAAGYTSFGEHSAPLNPFRRQLIGLSRGEIEHE